MGVRGFATFVGDNLRGDRASFELNGSGAPRNVVVDYFAFHHFILKSCRRARLGYMREFIFKTSYWLEIFIKARWNLTFIADGCLLGHRVDVRQARAQECVEAIAKYYSKADAKFSLSSQVPDKVSAAFSHAISWVLHKYGIKLIVAIGEADEYAAWYAVQCGAMLVSQDSDYFVQSLDPAPGSTQRACYVPIRSLELSADAQHLSCQQYFSRDVAVALNLPRDLLPVFALLVGNDFTQSDPNNILVSAPVIPGSQTTHLNRMLKVAPYRRGKTYFSSMAAVLLKLLNGAQETGGETQTSRALQAIAETVYCDENVASDSEKAEKQLQVRAYLVDGVGRYDLIQDVSSYAYPELGPDADGLVDWVFYLLQTHNLSSSLFTSTESSEKYFFFPFLLEDIKTNAGSSVAALRITQLVFAHVKLLTKAVQECYGFLSEPSRRICGTVFRWDFEQSPMVHVFVRNGLEMHKQVLAVDPLLQGDDRYGHYFAKIWRPVTKNKALEPRLVDLLVLLGCSHFVPFIDFNCEVSTEASVFTSSARVPVEWLVALLSVRELVSVSQQPVSLALVEAFLLSIIISGLVSRWPNGTSPTKLVPEATHQFARFGCLCYTFNLLFGVALLTDNEALNNQDWLAVDAMAFFHSLNDMAKGYHPFDLLDDNTIPETAANQLTDCDEYIVLAKAGQKLKTQADRVEMLRLLSFLVLHDNGNVKCDSFSQDLSHLAWLTEKKPPRNPYFRKAPFSSAFVDNYDLLTQYDKNWVVILERS